MKILYNSEVNPALVKSSPLSLALKNRLSAQAQAWQQAAKDLNPKISSKSIHQLRVLSRRLNALSALWSQKEGSSQAKLWEKRLKQLNRQLGEIRSWYVGIKILKKLRKNKEFIKLIKKKLEEKERAKLTENSFWVSLNHSFKAKAYNISKNLKLKPYFFSLQKAFAQFPEQDFSQALQAQSQVRLSRLKNSWKKFEDHSDVENLHCFRIALRKWRYILELWQEAGEEVSLSLQTLKQDQAHLGFIHDLEELREHLKSSARDKKEIEESKKILKALRQALKQKVKQELKNLPLPLKEMSEGLLVKSEA